MCLNNSISSSVLVLLNLKVDHLNDSNYNEEYNNIIDIAEVNRYHEGLVDKKENMKEFSKKNRQGTLAFLKL